MNRFGDGRLMFALCDPREVFDSRRRFRRAVLPLLDRVNHFYVPSGRWAFRGWVLLPRYEYDQLDRYSTDLQVEVSDTVTLQNLCIVQAQCVSRGLATDRNALYLVELTDGRGILCNKWFQFPATTSYNIRAPAYPETFHPGSMNSGTTWTWSTMLQNLWEQMVLHLGAWPGLPFTPSGTPEGFWLQGVSAWTALNDILDHLGLDVAVDLTSTTPFTIVQSGAADTDFDHLTDLYAPNLEDDLEWIDTGAARVPQTLKVLFRRRNSVYGTEETVTYRSDGPYQWDMTPLYSVSVSAPATFASAVGTHYLWSDFTVRYDMDNQPLAADVTTANQIAQERVTQYFREVYDATLGFMSRWYTGALPFATGSRVDGVCWFQRHDWSGWRTQLVRGPQPPWPEIWGC